MYSRLAIKLPVFALLWATLLSVTMVAKADISQAPLYLTASATPLMMLTLSRDEQLFNKAYPDYTDLDGDGKLDTTYQDAFDYSGYFDPNLCYTYTADNRFKAAAVATALTTNGKKHACGVLSAGRWSGNFLNWVAMSRIDVLRFVLYGGYRHDGATTDTGDTASKTVLERAHIPNDLHAWAKVYSGSDIISFTPYATATTFCNASFNTTDSPKIRIAAGAYPEWASTALQQCQWADDAYGSYATTTTTYSCPTNYGNTFVTGGVTKCRVTGYVYGGNTYNVTNTTCTGNIPTSGLGAIPRCVDATANTTTTYSCAGASGSNSCYDDAPKSAALLGGATGAIARVEVCDPAAASTLRESFCKPYGTTSYKPTGVLQEYAEPQTGSTEARVRFGMLSGSYSNPRSGGIVRRNIGKLVNNTGTKDANGCASADEISLTTGQFCTSPEAASGSIINSISSFKISNNVATWNGNWSDCGTYSINNRTGGNGHLNNPGSTTGTNYKCGAWGNPIAEMYGETLRYLSGNTSPTTAFSSGTDLTGLAAPTWKDPYSRVNNDGGSPYCALCNILVLSSGLSSFDGDEVPSIPVLGSTVDAATKQVGDLEGISGDYLIGRSLNHLATGQTGSTLVVGEAANTHEDLCQARTVDDLSKAVGLCPDTPAQEGTFKIGGLAFKARTQDLRSSATGIGVLNKPSDAKVYASTYAVALAESLPKFEIPVGDKKITLAPLCQANNTGAATAASSDWRSCFLGSVSIGSKTSIAPSTSTATATQRYVYGRALENDNSAGTFTFVWEDSQWGNDHDNDVVTMITYCVGAKCTQKTGIRNGTSASYTAAYSGNDICWRSDSDVCTAAATPGAPIVAADEVLVRIENVSAYAGNAMLTGYSISGAGAAAVPVVNNDGDGLKRIALRPGSTDNSILTQAENPPATWARPKVLKYKAGTTTVKQFQNPLWYAAKFGGFKRLDAALADDPIAQGDASWSRTENGVATPNTFFQVRDPAKLKTSLDSVFKQVLDAKESSAAAIATNSTRLDGDTLIYQARFNPKDWTGQIIAYPIDKDTGMVSTVAKWDTDTVTAPARTNPTSTSTATFTWNDATNVGIGFAWGNISAGQQTLLMNGGGTADGQNRLKWVLGQSISGYRTHKGWLGDIVNSDPFFVGAINFGYNNLPSSAPERTSYTKFRNDNAARTKMLYFGANDGMLHALDALTGSEKFAYVPAGVYANLPKLSVVGYQHQYYVDGGPNVGDAYFKLPNDPDANAKNEWHTVLVGTTAAGGKSVFALDVTSPVSTNGSLNFSEKNILWEITSETRCASDSADLTVPGCFADLGYTFGQATVGRMQDGTWVAIFGNGYNSTNKKAVLYIVNIANGALIRKIETCAATDSVCLAGNNGLSTPAIIVDNRRTIIAAYAGDLKGNLWKFDLSNTSSTAWDIAYGGPLFTAVNSGGTVQPITAPLEVGVNPVGGYMIYFGTGKYYETGDNYVGINPPVQSFYGIWDSGVKVSSRSKLQQQTIIYEDNVDVTDTKGTTDTNDDAVIHYKLRGVSNNAFTYSSNNLGWYMDLVYTPLGASGERVVSVARLRGSRIIFTTLTPNGDACTGGGSSFLMELDALSGGRTTDVVFDLNNDGKFGTGDYIRLADGTVIPASGMQSPVGIIKTPAIIDGGDKVDGEIKISSGSSGSIMRVKESQGGAPGRLSWRQLH